MRSCGANHCLAVASDDFTVYFANLPHPIGESFSGGLEKSRDVGVTWHALKYACGGPSYRRVAVNPLNSSHILLGSIVVIGNVAYGVVDSSSDGGETFSCDRAAITGWTTDPRVMAFDPAQPSIVYVGADGLYRSTDGGVTFRGPLTSSQGGLVQAQISGLAFDTSSKPNVLYVATLNKGLFRSRDHGVTFAPPVSVVARQGVYLLDFDIVIDPTAPSTLFASITAANQSGVTGRHTGVLKSTDGGNTFSAVLDGALAGNTQYAPLAVHSGEVIGAGSPTDKAFVTKLNATRHFGAYSRLISAVPMDCAYGISVRRDANPSAPAGDLICISAARLIRQGTFR